MTRLHGCALRRGETAARAARAGHRGRRAGRGHEDHHAAPRSAGTRRGRLRGAPSAPAARAALAVAAGLALLVGGVWSARNLIDHGSPFWPFRSTPWGDPVPPVIGRIDNTFLNDPIGTLEGRERLYFDFLAGGLVLLAGGLLSPLLAAGARHRRELLHFTAGAAIAVLAWANAPITGVSGNRTIDVAVLGTVR